MGRQIRRQQVVLFVHTLRELIREGRLYPYTEKEKNLATIWELGISIPEWKEHLLELTPDDFQYVTDERNACGPDKWVFYKEIHGRLIYIRLRLNAEKRRAICESFHFHE